MDEAKTYYANIVLPYGKAVLTCLERIAGLEIDMIAPSHGVIWRKPRPGDRRGVSRLGEPSAQAEGGGALRYDVGKHRGDGRGDSRRARRSRASARR